MKLGHLLLEGRYDKYVLDLSRLVVNNFKKNSDFDETFEIHRKNGEQVIAELIVQFNENKKQKWPYDINASFGPEDDDPTWQTLELDIEYNPSFFPIAMNDFIADIKGTLRHELEHAGQDNFSGKVIKYKKHDPSKDFKSYLLQANEIPAYVQGFYKIAKTKKMTMSDVLEDWFNKHKQNFKNPKKDWQKVKAEWTDWGIKNIPNAIWEQRKYGLVETIKKVDGKWVVYPKKGGKRLGTHDTKEKALAQLAAIEASKNK